MVKIDSGISRPCLDLQRDRTTVQYQRRLDLAGDKLLSWCRSCSVALEAFAENPRAMNDLLTRYLQTLYDGGAAFWWGPHSVLYVQTRWRHLKAQLRPSWDSISTGKLQRPVRSRIPFRLELVQAVSYLAVLHALHMEPFEAPLWWAFAVIWKIGFFGFLRPKEICSLRAAHVLTPGPGTFRSLNCVVLTVLDPKNRLAMGRTQARLVRDHSCVQWTSWYLRGLESDALLWPYGPVALRSSLQKLLRLLGLEHLGLCPSGFRAGGATHLLEGGTAVSSIRFQGGWASDRNLAFYLQEAESAQTVLKLNPRTARRLERFLTSFGFLEQPPLVSRAQFEQLWQERTQTRFSR
jgi:hypothetical protein